MERLELAELWLLAATSSSPPANGMVVILGTFSYMFAQ